MGDSFAGGGDGDPAGMGDGDLSAVDPGAGGAGDTDP